MRVGAVMPGAICSARRGMELERPMKIQLLAAVATIAVLACPGRVRAEGALDAVLAADRAFAAQAAESGAQAAFLDHLAPDGVLFRPTAVNGREWLRTHEEASGRLEWSPAAGAISCDGSLAVTLGPWSYRQETAAANGHYLTVWRREATGVWDVVLDHGIEDAPGATTASQAPAQFAVNWADTAGRPCDSGGEASDLADADDKLNEAIRTKGLDAALRRFAESTGLMLRDGHAPAAPTADWPRDESDIGSKLDAITRGTHAAPGSDMGYTYGELSTRGKRKGPGDVRAVFIRVWARDGRAWRLAVDVLTPLPAPTAVH
jgi:ketosteroid isomerase-like protein